VFVLNNNAKGYFLHQYTIIAQLDSVPEVEDFVRKVRK